MHKLWIGLLLIVAALEVRPAFAQFEVCNKTTISMDVAIHQYVAPSWQTKGWWNIKPDQCRTLVSGDLTSRYYFFHASNGRMNRTWQGELTRCVSSQAFTYPDDHACDGPSDRRARFVKVDTGDSKKWSQGLTCSSCPKDFDVGGGVGKFRECRQAMDCTPREDCTPRQDCSPTIDCAQSENCSACLLRNPLGGNCIQRGNDPICEARKATNKAVCESQKSARKASCEVEKTAEKSRCEAAKSTRKGLCETEKEGKRLDCERLKASEQVLAEVYEAAIHESKKSARSTTLKPIPPFIREKLTGYFTPELLDRVRYTTRWSDWASIQKYALEFNGMAAIVFDDIVVFKEENDALNNLRLWAHELEHVKQYQKLGIDGFAQMYMYKQSTIESNARKQEEHVCSTLGC